MDEAEIAKFVESRQLEHQADFDRDPKEYATRPTNGIGLRETTGLIGDARNSYYDLLNLWKNPSSASFDTLKPILSYQEYLQRKTFPVGLGEYLLRVVKPESLAEFNRLATEFNSELESIRTAKNFERVVYYAEALDKLLKS